jgi:hypothetical protein
MANHKVALIKIVASFITEKLRLADYVDAQWLRSGITELQNHNLPVKRTLRSWLITCSL